MALVKVCPNCNRRNAASSVVCEVCDTSLEKTKPIQAPGLAPPRISINNRVLKLPLKLEFVIGRAGEGTIRIPDIDLAPFGGSPAAGVSRKHARLTWNGSWQIQDLGSVNGTFVNQKRLVTNEVLTLPRNAVIQIGKLYLVFHG
ncbi:MAG: FHA domain-containing protein [Chloroflexota bacterium]|nr:MAG: FHA domain-containing protein [Chloroflexota bacterium]